MRADLWYRDQGAAQHGAEQDGDEGAHLDDAVAADQFIFVQMLWQVGVFDRAEQGRMHAHQEHADEQQRGHAEHETERDTDHEQDLEVLDQTDDARLVVFVGELAGGGREQQKRQDEDTADHWPGSGRFEATPVGGAVGGERSEGEFEGVVVGGTKELRQEEGQETPLLQQAVLTGVAHGC